MRLHVQHETTYRYEHKVEHTVQQLRLTPRREARQRTVAWQVQTPGRRSEQVDAFGNIGHLLTVDEPHSELRVTVSGIVETLPGTADGRMADEGGISPLVYLMPTRLTTPDDAVRALAAQALPAGNGTHGTAALWDLGELVRAAVKYTPGATAVDEAAAVVLARGAGVCQDHAHVFVAACRAAGLPARYVSGYLFEDALGGDVASHAWADVWLPATPGEAEGAWHGIDITHGMPAGERHARLAVGRDYLDAAPVRGVRRGGGNESLRVRVVVSNAPRVPEPTRAMPGLQQ